MKITWTLTILLALALTVHAKIYVDSAFAGGRKATAMVPGEMDDMTAPAVYGPTAGAGGNGDYVQENDNQHTQRFSGNGKVTVIDNKNTLDQAEEAPTDAGVNNAQEQHRKSTNEQEMKANNEMKTKQQEAQWRDQANEFQAKTAIRKEARQKEEATKATLRQYQQQEAEWTREQESKSNAGKEAQEKSRTMGVTDISGQSSITSASSTTKTSAPVSKAVAAAGTVELGAGYHNMAEKGTQTNWALAGSIVEDAFCFLKGVVFQDSALGNSFVMRLKDSGCQPDSRIAFSAIQGDPDQAARLDISGNGYVYYMGGATNLSWTSLSSVGFADQNVNTLTKFQPGWGAGEAEWRQPGVMISNGLCALTGHMVYSSTGNSASLIVSTGTKDKCQVDGTLVFLLPSGTKGYVAVEVRNDANVYMLNTANKDVFLDGILYAPFAGGEPVKGTTGALLETKIGYRRLSVFKTSKMCILSGTVMGAKKGQVLAILDICRPAERHILVGYDGEHGVPMRIDVLPNGQIIPAATASWISFSGMHYPSA